MSAALPAMLLASLLLHVLGFLVLTRCASPLRAHVAPPPLLVTELLVPPAMAEPVALAQPDTVELPAALPESAPLQPPPVEPPPVQPVTPPKLVARPMPRRVTAQAIPAPPVSRKPSSKPVASPPPGASRAVAEREPSLPGSPLPPAEGAAPATGNVLGPATAPTPEAVPPLPVEGGATGAGNLFARGDVGVVPGAGAGGGSGGSGRAGLGSGGAGTSGGTRVAGIPSGTAGAGSGSGLARPLGGYQVKPRYPETARRQGVEGTTLLRVHVSERGLVDNVLIERSAGYGDLDLAAMEAVQQWRFEPAKQGQRAVAVWVMLPVRFSLR